MSSYLIIIMLLLMVITTITMLIKNMVLSKELAALKARVVPLEIERDRQIRMGVFK